MNWQSININEAFNTAENVESNFVATHKAFAILQKINERGDKHLYLNLDILRNQNNNNNDFWYVLGKEIYRQKKNFAPSIPMDEVFAEYLHNPSSKVNLEPMSAKLFNLLVKKTYTAVLKRLQMLIIQNAYPETDHYLSTEFKKLQQRKLYTIEEYVHTHIFWTNFHPKPICPTELLKLENPILNFCSELSIEGTAIPSLFGIRKGFAKYARQLWLPFLSELIELTKVDPKDVFDLTRTGKISIQNVNKPEKYFHDLSKSVRENSTQPDQILLKLLSRGIAHRMEKYTADLAKACEEYSPPPIIPQFEEEIETENTSHDEENLKKLMRMDQPRLSKGPLISQDASSFVSLAELKRIKAEASKIAQLMKRFIKKNQQKKEETINRQLQGSMLDETALSSVDFSNALFKRVHELQNPTQIIFLAIDMSGSLDEKQVKAIHAAASAVVISQKNKNSKIVIAAYNSLNEPQSDEDVPKILWIKSDRSKSLNSIISKIAALRPSGRNWDKVTFEFMLKNHGIKDSSLINFFVLTDVKFNSCEQHKKSGLDEMCDFFKDLQSNRQFKTTVLAFDANTEAANKLAEVVEVVKIENRSENLGLSIANALLSHLKK